MTNDDDTPDRRWDDDAREAALEWAGWDRVGALHDPVDLDLTTETPTMPTARELQDQARHVGREYGQRADAELDRFDRRATKEVNRWSGRQWAMFVAAVVLALVGSFFLGRASADTQSYAIRTSDAAAASAESGSCATGWMRESDGAPLTDAELAALPAGVRVMCATPVDPD